MNMIGHKDVGINNQAFVLNAEFQTIDNKLFTMKPVEDIDPPYHCQGEKICVVLVINF